MIAILVSLVLAYAGGFLSLIDGSATVSDLFVGPLFLVPFITVFVSIGGLVAGLPTLIVLRKSNTAHSRSVMLIVGTIVGTLTSVLMLVGWLGLAVLPLALLYGVLGGVLSALLWFEMVESKRRNA
ncbi:hypothetical protein GRI42_04290 [Erythrobacter gaetbuli]|uniref:Uncharacterized protein n=1 Tax=Qipengyuania gaetbuli TaxID=266952 RepID=A0A844XXE6_9SPHN|nr:hypothetical protein [Qipengyuania gaetbuli]MXO50521.1 hypothetical protein [Qipengyuania gaetbuli]